MPNKPTLKAQVLKTLQSDTNASLANDFDSSVLDFEDDYRAMEHISSFLRLKLCSQDKGNTLGARAALNVRDSGDAWFKSFKRMALPLLKDIT